MILLISLRSGLYALWDHEQSMNEAGYNTVSITVHGIMECAALGYRAAGRAKNESNNPSIVTTQFETQERGTYLTEFRLKSTPLWTR